MTRAARLPLVVVSAVLLASLAVATSAGPTRAADPVTFGRPTASASFADGVAFGQPVTLAERPHRVELLLRVGDAPGPTAIPIATPGAGSTTLEHAIVDHIVPNTPFVARWRVVDADGGTWLGPEIRTVLEDDRFEWRTASGDLVRVHWYEGGDAFGRRALEIGETAVAETAALLGVTETEPIDFFIYPDREPFYDALGPRTRENVGGQAHPGIRTLFALISPGEIDDGWVRVVVPHELMHLVFGTAVDNPYRDPPHWLNEGLAVYLSQGYSVSDRAAVEGAADDGSIMPLVGLAGAFPTAGDRFGLAYAESASAVDRIVRVHGRDALVALIRSYATGVTDDEAFQTALGVDLAGFEAAWLEELGAETPVRHGPQPAPPGPLPDGWSGPAPEPGTTPPPGSGPTDAPTGGGDLLDVLGIALPVVALGLIIVVMVGSRRRGRSRDGGAP